jgi:subtilisin family serine protease
MTRLITFWFLLVLSSFSQLPAQEKISPRLNEELAIARKTRTTVKAVIVLQDQFDLTALEQQLTESKSNLQEKALRVITGLQRHAEQTQAGIIDFFESKNSQEVAEWQNFWIMNALALEARPEVILELSQHPEVALLESDTGIDLIRPVNRQPAPSVRNNSSEPGLRVINAHRLWSMGITGEGVIVMNLDTGVDGLHPALATRWRGNDPGVQASAAWYDFEGSTFPNDPFYGVGGHGTHTMGIITGLDTITHDTVGVAFGAKWIAARIFMPENMCYNSAVLSAFQWAIDPDGHPETAYDMPAVISNSWGSGYRCNVFFQPAMDALEAAGVALVFAAGNSGPAASTISAPAMVNINEMNVFSVGAVDGNTTGFPIAIFSSRGPTFCTGLGNQIKPEVSAPGVYVRSCLPGNIYEYGSGTSASSPHVAGAIALLKQVFPSRSGVELKQMLYENAYDRGPTGEDNAYGMGIIDAYAALLANTSTAHPMPLSQVSAYSDYLTPNSINLAWEDPHYTVGGDSLILFTIEIWRDNQYLTSIASGVETYTDLNLSDGTKYEYSLFTHHLVTDSSSSAVKVSAFAGGSPIPSPPANLHGQVVGDSVVLQWDDPTTQTDGTILDDLDQILLYRDDTLLAQIAPATETFTDYPVSGSTVFYTAQALDNELPAHYSQLSNEWECFAGATPDYLVWYGTGVLSTIASAESIFYAIRDLGESAYLTDDLFVFGTDLSIYRAIFVVLGSFDHCFRFYNWNPEPLALENYLYQGGNIYLEGGHWYSDAYWTDLFVNIRPWFSLAAHDSIPNIGTLTGMEGMDFLSGFSFNYSWFTTFVDTLRPEFSTPIWIDPATGRISGVWHYQYGRGHAIGVVHAFGGLSDKGLSQLSRRSNSSYSANVNNRIFPQLRKTELMRIYLDLFKSHPPLGKYLRFNSLYQHPANDTLQLAVKTYNPDHHSHSVRAMIENFQQTIMDTLDLFDDGQHNDSLANDDLFGGYWPVPAGEYYYTARSYIHSDSLNTTSMAAGNKFSTVGPVIVDTFLTSTGNNILHPADSIMIMLQLKNFSNSYTIRNVNADISSASPGVKHIYAEVSYDDIPPGGSVTTQGVYYLVMQDSCPSVLQVIFNVDIATDGQAYWQDNLVFDFVTGLGPINDNVPLTFRLNQNYPNPFNPVTVISWQLAISSRVKLSLYNIAGQEVAVLVDTEQKAGYHQLEFDASGLASGIYLYRLKSGDFVQSRKMLLLR